MNGFTHLKDIRFSDAKANILLRSGAITRENLINAKNSIIEINNVHFGVAKRINDTTAVDVKHLGVWYPVVCGDTNRLHEIYCMDNKPTVAVTVDPEEYTKHDENIVDDNQVEVADTVDSVDNVVDVTEDQIPEMVEELVDEQEESVVDEEVMEENVESEEEQVIEEEIDNADAGPEQPSEVFVTGMMIEEPASENTVMNNSVNSTTTVASTNYNNQNQGNARRQVNINQNHNNAKRRHR